MADTIDRYIIDVSQLKAALREAQDEAKTTEEAFEDLSKVIDDSMKESAESAEKAGEGVEKAGDDAKEAGGKAEQGGESFKVAWIAAAAAAATAATAVTKLFSEVLDLSDEINVMAKRAKVANTSIGEFQKVQGVFDMITEGGANAATVVAYLQRNIDEAREGTEEQADAFDRLGISVDSFAKLPLVDQLEAIGDGMMRLEDRGAQTNIAMSLLGRSGKNLVPVFNEGGKAIREAAEMMEVAGVVSDEQGKRSEALQDSVYLMNQAFQALKADVLDPLIPKMKETADNIQAILAHARETGALSDLGDAMNKAFTDDILKGLEDAVEFATKLGGAIDFVARVFGFLQASASFLPALVADTVKLATGFKDGAEFADDFKRRIEKLSFGLIQFQDETRAAAKEVEELVDEGRELNKVFPGLNETFTVSSRMLRELKEKKDEAAASSREHKTAIEEEIEAVEELTEAVVKSLEDRLALTREVFEEEADLFDDSMAQEKEGRDRLRAIKEADADADIARAKETADVSFAVATSLASSLEGVAQTVLQAKIAAAKDGTEAQKKEAMDAFYATQAAAIASAAINTALAITNMIANVPGVAGIALGVAAGVAGGVATAAIAAEQPPALHAGGMVERAHSGRLAADETPIIARAGEGILTSPGVAAAGGPGAVAALNRGEGMGGSSVFVMRVGNRTTEAMLSDNLRQRDGVLSKAIRETQPRVARHVPALVGV